MTISMSFQSWFCWYLCPCGIPYPQFLIVQSTYTCSSLGENLPAILLFISWAHPSPHVAFYSSPCLLFFCIPWCCLHTGACDCHAWLYPVGCWLLLVLRGGISHNTSWAASAHGCGSLCFSRVHLHQTLNTSPPFPSPSAPHQAVSSGSALPWRAHWAGSMRWSARRLVSSSCCGQRLGSMRMPANTDSTKWWSMSRWVSVAS